VRLRRDLENQVDQLQQLFLNLFNNSLDAAGRLTVFRANI
jgi:nitrogen-specific signal transduction histidine kinase